MLAWLARYSWWTLQVTAVISAGKKCEACYCLPVSEIKELLFKMPPVVCCGKIKDLTYTPCIYISFTMYVCAFMYMLGTYDLDVRAGSDARGNVGGNTLPLPVVLLGEWLEL